MTDLMLTELVPKSRPREYWTKEQKSAWYKQYYRTHKEHLNAKRKEWRGKNRERDNAVARAYNARWRKANPEKLARMKRNNYLKATYGLTVDGYNEIVKRQNNLCAMCFKHLSKGSHFHHADHNHITGKFRAIICARCNTFVGHIEKNPDIFKQALSYLGKHK